MKKLMLSLAAICLLLYAGFALAEEEEIIIGEYEFVYYCNFCGRETIPQYSITSHWLYCPDCDYKHLHRCHSDHCTTKGMCDFCEMTNVHMDYTYHGNWGAAYDDTYHFLECDTCGGRENEEMHYTTCGGDTCRECGATELSDRVPRHNYRYGFNDQTHWAVCSDCGYNAPEEAHISSCVYPNLCSICPNVFSPTPDAIYHNYKSPVYRIADDSHAAICNDCGELGEWTNHTARCDEPTICADCGKTAISSADLIHTGEYYQFENRLFCRQYCKNCMPNGAQEPTAHVLNIQSMCTLCLEHSSDMLGDVNLDMTHDAADLLLLLQYAAGWGTELPLWQVCDINDNLEIDMTDVQLIYAYISQQ